MGRKEKEGEDFWEKRWPGWRTPPLLFPEITDYLTQINNLSRHKKWAEGGGRGCGGYEVRAAGEDGETAPPLQYNVRGAKEGSSRERDRPR